MPVTLCLQDEVDVSRGDMLVRADQPQPHQSTQVETTVVWMGPEPFEPQRQYVIKHTTRQMRAVVHQIHYRIDVNTLEHQDATQLCINEIGVATIESHQPFLFDPYRRNRSTGAFILIDPLTNITVGAGMIERPAAMERKARRVTHQEREARYGHKPHTIWLHPDDAEITWALERTLFDRQCLVQVLTETPDAADLRRLHDIGAIVICISDGEPHRDRMCLTDLPTDPDQAVQHILFTLGNAGILLPD